MLTIGINLAITGTVTVASGGGGGGGSPTPLVSADFKNGVYAIGGVSKTLADVWEVNPDWGTDPITVVGGAGLQVSNADGEGAVSTGPAMTAAAFTGLAGGFVVVVSYASTGNGYVYFELDDAPAYSAGWFFKNVDPHPVASDYNGAVATSGATSVGPHKAALVFSASALALSVGGEAAATGVPQALSPVLFGIGLSSGGSVAGSATLAKIEFFSLADYGASDLPALSAP